MATAAPYAVGILGIVIRGFEGTLPVPVILLAAREARAFFLSFVQVLLEVTGISFLSVLTELRGLRTECG